MAAANAVEQRNGWKTHEGQLLQARIAALIETYEKLRVEHRVSGQASYGRSWDIANWESNSE